MPETVGQQRRSATFPDTVGFFMTDSDI